MEKIKKKDNGKMSKKCIWEAFGPSVTEDVFSIQNLSVLPKLIITGNY